MKEFADSKRFNTKIIALLFIAIVLILPILSSCTESTSQEPNNVATGASAISEEESLKEVYSDDLITVYFVKKYDTPQMQGMFSFDLKAENKSGKKITIYLKDTSLNGSMVSVGSGVPLELESGKSGANSYFGKYEGTGITTSDEIKKIGFKILVMDTSSNVLETTESIEVEF